jgi:hypothetical protein
VKNLKKWQSCLSKFEIAIPLFVVGNKKDTREQKGVGAVACPKKTPGCGDGEKNKTFYVFVFRF